MAGQYLTGLRDFDIEECEEHFDRLQRNEAQRKPVRTKDATDNRRNPNKRREEFKREER